MQRYDELKKSQTVYLANREGLWDMDSEIRLGDLLPYTELRVIDDDVLDNAEVWFEVVDGEFKGRKFMWVWWGEGYAMPSDLLSEIEYRDFVTTPLQLLVNKTAILTYWHKEAMREDKKIVLFSKRAPN